MAIHSHSFPMYLADADPWTHAGDRRALETFQHIVADKKRVSDRIGAVLIEEDRPTDPGSFPMEFTSANDLSLDYLVRCAIDYQAVDVAAIAECARQLRLAPAARGIAEEALGLAKGHLEALQELVATPVPNAV
jgi:hypothetical protein